MKNVLRKLTEFSEAVKKSGKPAEISRSDELARIVPDPDEITSFAGITEHFCYRHEREWRIVETVKPEELLDGKYTRKFSYADLTVLVCPEDYIDRLKEELKQLTELNILIRSSESLR